MAAQANTLWLLNTIIVDSCLAIKVPSQLVQSQGDYVGGPDPLRGVLKKQKALPT